MSSLLQFDGRIGDQGVRLEFYVVKEPVPPRLGAWVPTETTLCTRCDRSHPHLWYAWRKPVGTLGHWVQFRYCGCVHAPDLSVPIRVWKLPRGAQRMTIEENAEAWHRS